MRQRPLSEGAPVDKKNQQLLLILTMATQAPNHAQFVAGTVGLPPIGQPQGPLPGGVVNPPLYGGPLPGAIPPMVMPGKAEGIQYYGGQPHALQGPG